MKQRVFIIGGGIASLSAAWSLIRSPRANDFAITVFQPGWRLGGKCASGRRLDARARIEEHGLHVWNGSYANAFSIIRDVYERDAATTSLPRWYDPDSRSTSAFWPETAFTLFPAKSGRPPLEPRGLWAFDFPRTRALPGDGTLFPSASEWLTALVHVAKHVARLAADPRHAIARDDLRLIVDLVWTVLRGSIRDQLWLRNVDRIDHLDFRAWLARHGASRETLEGPFVRAWYAYFFALSRDGSPTHLSAATAFRTLIRFLLMYRGSLFWLLQGGMGDVVFAPLYRMLARHGVDFRFFHRAQRIDVDAHNRADRLIVAEQVRVVGKYDPLIDVEGLPSWPAEPKWDALHPDDRSRARAAEIDLESEHGQFAPASIGEFRLHRDFDQLIVGTPPRVTEVLLKESLSPFSKLLRALREAKTVSTASVQLWLDRPKDGETQVGSLATPPLETWADLDEYCALESAQGRALGMLAMCGACDDEVDHRELLAQSEAFLQTSRPGTRIVDRYVRTNHDASARYGLAPPGTAITRIRADESGIDRLLLAGDWLYTGLNVGCVEAAVMSGLRAGRTLSGFPSRIVGEDERWLFNGFRRFGRTRAAIT